MLYTAGFLLVLVIAYVVYQQQVKADKRRERTTRLRVALIELNQAEAAFTSFTAAASGYFANYQLQSWKVQYAQLFAVVNGVSYNASELASAEKATIQCFLDHYQRGEELRQAYNRTFIPAELQRYDHLFSHVEGRSLDAQQRTAIVSDEDNNLVVAGAGSGKTTTIVGKVQYVLDRYRTPPENILLISFTRKSASTLAERVGINGIMPRTFHRFGMDIIAAVEGKKPSLYDEHQFSGFVASTFRELMHDPTYAKKVTAYFVRDLKPVSSAQEFQNPGAYIQYLKDNDYRSYKSVAHLAKGKTTYRREVVKSVEEWHIANFLLFNGVDYQYEAPYEHNTATLDYTQWKPDFTITQGSKKVYLEHFGIDREGNVPPFFAKDGQTLAQARQRYHEKMEWARQTSRTFGTALLESYSYELSENRLFPNLRAQLAQHGIELRPKSPAEIWEIIATAAEDEVNSFYTLLQTFINHLKSNNYSIEQVREINRRDSDKRQQVRNERFLEVVEPLFMRYQAELAKRQELDFNDLINQAAGYVESGAYCKRFDYIIIDEFQDISKGRYHLIRALKQQNPHCKLFCVGDDWQSIYRFAGSDLGLFKNFQKHFGFSLQSNIETTYRYHEPLISESGSFIMKNPNQTPKNLKSGIPGKRTDYRIVYNESSEQDDTATLQRVLDELIAATPTIAQKEIMVLGRYSFDLKRIKNESCTFTVNHVNNTLKYPYTDAEGNRSALHLSFLTVHKSKGLEADIVIVLNCSSGKLGFPSEMSDDPVLSLLLSEADQFENGEERRLFYVALTRAKEQVLLITDPAFKSKFITELETKSDVLTLKKCPRCRTADLLKRTGTTNGKLWAFYGCSNYAYGCEYREWLR